MDLNNIKFSWLDKHPIDWEMKRVKHIFHLSKSKVESSEGHPILSLTMKGIKFRDVSTNEGQLPENFDGYTLLDKDDIVFNPMDLISGWVDKSNVQGLISPSYKVLRTQKKNINRDYFKYFFQTHYTEKIFFPFGEGVHYQYRWGLGSQTLLNFPILVPPHQDQNKIVQFLDEKTELIDKLISTKERKITLLKEQRTSLINKVVTKGLNPNVKLRNSGVEWIGEIPEHWVVTKFNRYVFFQEGPGLRTFQFTDEGTKVICVTNITENGIDFSYKKFISNEEYLEKYQHFTVQKGDLLLSSSGNSWGKVSEYLEDEKVMLNTSTIRLNTLDSKRMNKTLIKYILKSEFVRTQLDILMTGSCQPNFGPSHLNQLIITVPPIEEQIEIISNIEKYDFEFQKLIHLEQKKIDLLKEYRQSLISEVVTGKIKVTTDE